jgi:CRP/FNR family transcriptional regulator
VNILKVLSKQFIFEDFEEEDLQTLASHSELVRLGKKQNLFYEGDEANHLFIVIHGRVSIYKIAEDGSEIGLHEFGSGNLVAEAAIFNKKRYPAYCKSVEETTLIKIPAEVFLRTITLNPQNSLKIMASYAVKLRQFVDLVEYLSLTSVQQRLVLFLVKNGIAQADGTYILELGVKKRKLAAMLGTVPETLSRNLKKLREQELITEEGDAIIIHDMSEMKNLLQNPGGK